MQLQRCLEPGRFLQVPGIERDTPRVPHDLGDEPTITMESGLLNASSRWARAPTKSPFCRVMFPLC